MRQDLPKRIAAVKECCSKTNTSDVERMMEGKNVYVIYMHFIKNYCLCCIVDSGTFLVLLSVGYVWTWTTARIWENIWMVESIHFECREWRQTTRNLFMIESKRNQYLHWYRYNIYIYTSVQFHIVVYGCICFFLILFIGNYFLCLNFSLQFLKFTWILKNSTFIQTDSS